jgi:hypothetical protein
LEHGQHGERQLLRLPVPALILRERELAAFHVLPPEADRVGGPLPVKRRSASASRALSSPRRFTPSGCGGRTILAWIEQQA